MTSRTCNPKTLTSALNPTSRSKAGVGRKVERTLEKTSRSYSACVASPVCRNLCTLASIACLRRLPLSPPLSAWILMAKDAQKRIEHGHNLCVRRRGREERTSVDPIQYSRNARKEIGPDELDVLEEPGRVSGRVRRRTPNVDRQEVDEPAVDVGEAFQHNSRESVRCLRKERWEEWRRTNGR